MTSVEITVDTNGKRITVDLDDMFVHASPEAIVRIIDAAADDVKAALGVSSR